MGLDNYSDFRHQMNKDKIISYDIVCLLYIHDVDKMIELYISLRANVRMYEDLLGRAEDRQQDNYCWNCGKKVK